MWVCHRTNLLAVTKIWSWQLSAFIKCIASEFNKRVYCMICRVVEPAHISTGWFEEQKPDCKTPLVNFELFFI
jgi:hypothetical protein